MIRHHTEDSPNALLNPPNLKIEDCKNDNNPIVKYRKSSELKVKGFELKNGPVEESIEDSGSSFRVVIKTSGQKLKISDEENKSFAFSAENSDSNNSSAKRIVWDQKKPKSLEYNKIKSRSHEIGNNIFPCLNYFFSYL